MNDEWQPGWKSICWERMETTAAAPHYTGLMIAGVPVLGVRVKPDYPGDDDCWPNRGAAIGIVIAGHFTGLWNDPGY